MTLYTPRTLGRIWRCAIAVGGTTCPDPVREPDAARAWAKGRETLERPSVLWDAGDRAMMIAMHGGSAEQVAEALLPSVRDGLAFIGVAPPEGAAWLRARRKQVARFIVGAGRS